MRGACSWHLPFFARLKTQPPPAPGSGAGGGRWRGWRGGRAPRRREGGLEDDA